MRRTDMEKAKEILSSPVIKCKKGLRQQAAR